VLQVCKTTDRYYVLQKARDGTLDEIPKSERAFDKESTELLRAFLSGMPVKDGWLTKKCDSAHPLCHFPLALSRIAEGKYDPADFYEFYKYYPLFRDLVDDFATRREQAIKTMEKKKKEAAVSPKIN
jgi:hypothetical protein